MDPIILELIKLGLTAFFTEMKLQGKSEDEILQIFKQEKARFDARPASDLPDV